MVNNGGLQPQASATLLCPMFDSSMTKTNMGISEKIVANWKDLQQRMFGFTNCCVRWETGRFSSFPAKSMCLYVVLCI